MDADQGVLLIAGAIVLGVPLLTFLLSELGRGVAQDEAQAQKYYREAAQHQYVQARYNLALMLEDGRGSPRDEAACPSVPPGQSSRTRTALRRATAATRMMGDAARRRLCRHLASADSAAAWRMAFSIYCMYNHIPIYPTTTTCV